MILSTILSGSAFAQAAPLLKESKGLQLLEEIQDAISQLAEDVTPTVVGRVHYPTTFFTRKHSASGSFQGAGIGFGRGHP